MTEEPRPLRSVPVHHGVGFGEPGREDSDAPGYCWCGRWAEECPGLAAIRRGEEPPPLERIVWTPIDL